MWGFAQLSSRYLYSVGRQASLTTQPAKMEAAGHNPCTSSTCRSHMLPVRYYTSPENITGGKNLIGIGLTCVFHYPRTGEGILLSLASAGQKK